MFALISLYCFTNHFESLCGLTQAADDDDCALSEDATSASSDDVSGGWSYEWSLVHSLSAEWELENCDTDIQSRWLKTSSRLQKIYVILEQAAPDKSPASGNNELVVELHIDHLWCMIRNLYFLCASKLGRGPCKCCRRPLLSRSSVKNQTLASKFNLCARQVATSGISCDVF